MKPSLPNISLRHALSLGSLALFVTSTHAQDSTQLPTMTIRAEQMKDAGSYAPSSISVGSKVAVSPLEVPQSVSVVTRQRIEDQNLITLGDALNEVTGVTVSPWDSMTHQYRSRGYVMDMAYDGVPLYGTGGHQQFDLAIYERVEVLRGPAALFMGSGQGGGLVNLVRKRGLEQFGASLTTSAGSWDNYRTELDVGGPLSADGRLRSRFVGSWHEHDYFWDVTHKEKWLGYGTLDYDLTPNTVISVSFTHQQDHTDSPSMGLPAYTDGRFLEVSRSTHVYPDWNMIGFETSEVAFDLEHRLANDWVVKSKLLERRQDWFYKDSFPAVGVDPQTGLIGQYNRRASDSDIEQSAFDIYTSGPFELLSRTHEMTVGYNRNRLFDSSRYGNASPVFNVPLDNPSLVPEPATTYTSGYENDTRQQGVYGQTRLSISDPLTLVLGARASNFERKSRNVSPSTPTQWRTGSKETGEFTPYGGLVYYLTPNITSYVSYSDIFIPQGQLTAAGGTLEPRVGSQWEAGLKGQFFEQKLNASLAVYRTRDENRVMQDQNNPGFFLAAGEVEVEGWEFEVSGRPTPNLNLSLGYAYVNSKYLEDLRSKGGKFSLFEPKHSLKTFAKYQFTEGPLERAFVGGGVHINSGGNGSSGTDLRTQSGYALFNAQIGYQVASKTSVALLGNNLFDREYYARVGGVNTYNTFGDPRNFTLMLRTAL
ncbi:TonB-dependent siderophore receptor [Stutzerimonas zhaodongensis]|uniref:TonB-dependent siderophore receptor n=1 Tax=Stutzerimonas zhaodongensis TaxID=1176257 RepID=A0A3M2HKW4_9GAMM|nr:TonB-dependent siderophore receptor [Stutzerimonas zhaodongensis]MCQ4316297.1 TonB-dependent siderophore receptor [Stutzerimonas zhaodongensis]RMH89658.1 TonB-dependent siderophore receptor [Stutzerimonas zhaodongensis]